MQIVTQGLKYFIAVINRKNKASIRWNLYNKQTRHFRLTAVLLLNMIKSGYKNSCAYTAKIH